MSAGGGNANCVESDSVEISSFENRYCMVASDFCTLSHSVCPRLWESLRFPEGALARTLPAEGIVPEGGGAASGNEERGASLGRQTCGLLLFCAGQPRSQALPGLLPPPAARCAVRCRFCRVPLALPLSPLPRGLSLQASPLGGRPDTH